MNAASIAGWPAVSPVAACSPPPRFDVAAVAGHKPPAVRSSRGRDQRREAAARTGHKGRHAPLGFYAGVFGHAVQVTAEGSEMPGRAAAAHVQTRMFLDERVVGVGSASGGRGCGCRPDAVLSHDPLYAGRDDRPPSHDARRVSAMFDRMPPSAPLGAPGRGDAENRMTAAVRRTLDDPLRPYDDRARASDTADGDEEGAKPRVAGGRAA